MGKKKKETLMTDEERIAFEEQKRYAEEEVKKKREDVLAQFLKDKLLKEEKAAFFNMNKLNCQWRVIMRDAKAKDLIKDIEILSQTFERVIDSKDAVIKSLVKDIAEAEEQYAMALRSHLQKIDFLMDLQMKRIVTLNQEYALELEIICEEFDLERSIFIEQHMNDMSDIADIIFAMEDNFETRENEAHAEFQSMQDEIKNKNLEDKHALKVQLETKIDDLWQQFKQALQNYNEMNEERKNTFETLKQKDLKNTKDIEMQMRKLQRLSDQIAQTRAKMAASAKDSEDRNKSLKEDKERVQQHLQVLKAEMNQIRDCEREKLTQLTIASNSAIKILKQQKKKGEQILRLAEMCRKLETEEEKVLPFFASSLTSEEKLKIQGEQILRLAEMCRKLETEEEKVLPFFASSLTSEEKLKIQEAMLEPPTHQITEIMHQCSELDNFWKRYNKVLLDKLSVEREKQGLTNENHKLRMLLKQYLDGISVNEEILSQVNPLLVVNNRTNLRMNVPLTDGRIKRPAARTVVEAAHIVKHGLT